MMAWGSFDYMRHVARMQRGVHWRAVHLNLKTGKQFVANGVWTSRRGATQDMPPRIAAYVKRLYVIKVTPK